jgi:multidrug efflux pump subunit AcrB
VTRSLSVNLAGSLQTAPTFWLNPKNGVSYPIVVQAPPYRADSLADLYNVPVSAGGTAGLQTLSGLGTIHRERTAAVLAHYAARP